MMYLCICYYRCSIYYNLYYNTAIKVVKNRVTEENKSKIKPVFKPYFYCISAVLQLLSRIFGKDEVTGSIPVNSSMSRRAFWFAVFFYQKIRLHLTGCRSFIAKGHIRVGYSVASALITPLAHYQPFAKRRLRRKYLYGSALPKRQASQRFHP